MVWNEDEAKAAIKKYISLIDVANKAGAPTNQMDALRTSLKAAVTAFGSGDLNGVFNSILDTQTKLNDTVSELGANSNRLWKPFARYFEFVYPIYGFWPLLTALTFFIVYVSLLWLWQPWYQYTVSVLAPLKHPGFGIPMWSALFAGIGACVQIIVGVTNDVRTDGFVDKYRRIWYYFLPVVGPVFGVIAYILLSLGFLSLSGITAEQLGKQTFSVILVCFLAGYSTEWFMGVLGNLTNQTPH